MIDMVAMTLPDNKERNTMATKTPRTKTTRMSLTTAQWNRILTALGTAEGDAWSWGAETLVESCRNRATREALAYGDLAVTVERRLKRRR